MQPLTFHSWVIIQPSTQLRGEWIAHCLEFDVVTQGSSVTQVMEMIADATSIIIVDDLANGRNPADRNTAPAECREQLNSILRDGARIDAKDVINEKRV